MRTYVCMYVCMYVCIYVCMYVYMYVCMYVCVCLILQDVQFISLAHKLQPSLFSSTFARRSETLSAVAQPAASLLSVPLTAHRPSQNRCSVALLCTFRKKEG